MSTYVNLSQEGDKYVMKYSPPLLDLKGLYINRLPDHLSIYVYDKFCDLIEKDEILMHVFFNGNSPNGLYKIPRFNMTPKRDIESDSPALSVVPSPKIEGLEIYYAL